MSEKLAELKAAIKALSAFAQDSNADFSSVTSRRVKTDDGVFDAFIVLARKGSDKFFITQSFMNALNDDEDEI